MGVVSVAGISVWPREVCRDYPTRVTEALKNKVTYTCIGLRSATIVNERERRVRLHVAGKGSRVKV